MGELNLKSQTTKSVDPVSGLSPESGGAAIAPWAAARGLAHLPELVFFDSALVAKGATSRVAACPAWIAEGETAEDWARLQGAVRERAGTRGMAAGSVDYGGRFHFACYEDVAIYDHGSGRWSDEGQLLRKVRQRETTPASEVAFARDMAPEAYLGMVRRAREYIAAGDIYQVNLAHQFTGSWSGEPGAALDYYGRLRACSPAPYAALLFQRERVVCSSSPELFLRMEGREITTRPIKGTRARGPSAEADQAAAEALAASGKERAELTMITDLERNDLGQVCEYGSVSVREMLKLERYAQVFHLVSTVTGRLREGVDHVSALRACFPGGSITGAPKRRAREIIAELEPAARGLYTGAIGYFDFGGASCFSIAIRTAVLERQRGARGYGAHFGVGAGIVADSEPLLEWEETLHKAKGLLLAARSAEETF